MEDFLKKYHVDFYNDKLGQGGLADVYKAYDKEANQFVATKRSPKRANYTLKQEFERVKVLNHKNIVKYYQHYDVKSTLGIFEFGILELVEGKDLLYHINNNSLSENEKLRIAVQILEGIEYLHQQRILHRDIQPSNIMVTPDYQVKIIGFGISRYIRSHNHTITYNVGARPYMSPESLMYLPNTKIRASSDFWSFGVLFFQLFTGKLPFFKTVEDLRTFEEYENKFPWAELRKLPKRYQKVLKRCLEYYPDRRVQSSRELLDILDSSGNIYNSKEVSSQELSLNEFQQLYEVDFNSKNLLGQGGFSDIFKGYDKRRRVNVAVKRSLFRGKSNYYSLKREFNLAKNLNHPNVVKHFDYHLISTSTGKFEVIILELVSGKDLNEWLKKRTFSLTEKHEIIIQMINGLKYLHEQGIIFRELKLSNIMLDYNNHVKIIDFGVSESVEYSDIMKNVGTRLYMPPEAHQFIDENISFQSDFWTLGVSIFQLFTGELPFKNYTHYLSLSNYTNNYPSQKLRNIPFLYKEIIKKCTKYYPKDRPKSCEELLEILPNMTSQEFNERFNLLNDEIVYDLVLKKSFSIEKKGLSYNKYAYAQSFERQYAIVSKLNHINILKYNYYKLPDDTYTDGYSEYLLIDDISYEQLSDFLEKNENSNFKYSKSILELLKGIKHIHDNEIVHLSLSPSSIYINNEGNIRIGNFEHSILTNVSFGYN